MAGTDPFVTRHLGPGADERDKMLAALGLGTLEDLVDSSMPASIRMTQPLNLPPALSESDTLVVLRRLAAQNQPLVPMIGLGYHATTTPSVIRRNVLEDPAWYTAYTPYQPVVRDEGSLNGVYVNRDLVEEAVLRHGDEVQIGKFRLVYFASAQGVE